MRPTARQMWALIAAAVRELVWGLRAVTRELRLWRKRALVIADPEIRRDALIALDSKRGHADGAALFWTLPRTHGLRLLRLFVTYELIWDYLDNASEHGAHMGERNGRQLHLALIDALDPWRVRRDYYRYHPWRQDCGYLAALVASCQEGCAALPSYARVRGWLLREGRQAQVLALNHHRDPTCRDRALRQWATEELPAYSEVVWFELAGAASASLTIHALLALAGDPGLSDAEVDAAHRVYFPWLSLATTMLDSHVDRVEDAANGEHSYIAHYTTSEVATRRIGAILGRSMNAAAELRDGCRHVVIAACMAAMYLSKDSARAREIRASSESLAHAGGPMVVLLVPVLRVWRTVYGQRSA